MEWKHVTFQTGIQPTADATIFGGTRSGQIVWTGEFMEPSVRCFYQEKQTGLQSFRMIRSLQSDPSVDRNRKGSLLSSSGFRAGKFTGY
jgi:hypothetical protein